MSNPVIFKRTKSKPAQRTRQSSPDPDDNTAAAGGDSPSTLATKLKNKVKRTQPKSRLSFGGDDEEGDGEAFQVKKSNLSQKLALGKLPSLSKNVMPMNLDQASISLQSNGGPIYDKAHLSQLKASTPTSRPPRPGNSTYDADTSMDVDDISMQSAETVDIFEPETAIPSESSIKVAKERRERLRATGVAGDDDFISLSVIRRDDESQGPHPESRLVREEDELGEGDDEFAEYTSAQERIALGKKSRKVEASKRRDAMKEMIADAEEDDDETMEWEQEQLRRGGHKTPEPSSSAVEKQTYKPAPIPQPTSIPTLGPALARLTESFTQLTASHTSNTTALSALARERLEIEEREQELREMVGRAQEKRVWFESFKEWVEGVAGFLDQKFPQLEKLEEEYISLLQERFEMIAQRRHADDEDDLSTFLGSLPVPPPSSTETEAIDELGRTIPRPNPAVLKHERRAARLTRYSKRQLTHKSSEEEGYSTDSSLPPSDATSYRSAITSLLERKTALLSDVRAAEFRDPAKGKWWGEWRERYADSYVGAWGGLGVVGAWEFWVRLEIVGCDFIEDPRSLDSFKWYKGLYEYSRPGDDAEEERQLGPDGDLVSAMISTAIIPRLCKIVEEGALDVYSEKHVKRAVDLAEEVEASLEAENVKFQMLLKSVCGIFERAVATNESLIAKYTALQRPPSFDPESIPARSRFLARRIKLVRNMVRWRKYTGERLGIGQLITRSVKECVENIADGGWEVGGKDAAEKLVTILPAELIPREMKTRLGLT